MKISIEASDHELRKWEGLAHQHLDELVAAAACRCGELHKSAGYEPTTPLEKVVGRLQRQWVAGYRKQMKAMLAELKAKMAEMPSTLPTAAKPLPGDPNAAV